MAKQREELIEMRQLRYFIALAEELHFARAAERLKMEQSLLSRAIREMERILGVRVFERSTRSTRITRAGMILLDYARRAVALMEQASTSARSAALGQSNQLRLGVSDCTAYCRMMEVLALYHTQSPDVSVTLCELPLHGQIKAIRDGLLDGSITVDASYRDGIESHAVSRAAIGALVSATHPLARAEEVLPEDLARFPLILFSSESDLGAGIETDVLVGTFGRPRIAFCASSLGTMVTLVALGHGIGIVGSDLMAGIKRTDVVLRPIRTVHQSLVTYVLHSACGLPEPLEDFIRVAREVLSADSPSELS